MSCSPYTSCTLCPADRTYSTAKTEASACVWEDEKMDMCHENYTSAFQTDVFTEPQDDIMAVCLPGVALRTINSAEGSDQDLSTVSWLHSRSLISSWMWKPTKMQQINHSGGFKDKKLLPCKSPTSLPDLGAAPALLVLFLFCFRTNLICVKGKYCMNRPMQILCCKNLNKTGQTSGV